jgi:hypothetical protein
LLLALPADDRLAEGPPVLPANLDSRAWVTVVRRPPDINRAPFLAACSRAGFMPLIA